MRSTPNTRGHSLPRLALVAGITCAGGLLTIACGEKKEPPPPPPPEVLITQVVRRDVPIVTELVGQTKGFQDVDVRARVEGFLEEVSFNEGNGDNPLAIIIPCHRVIGADGSLTGYGGGLWRKKKLLDLEARTEALRLPGF